MSPPPGAGRGESPTPPARCLNCDAVLAGQYCGRCGQRAQSRLIGIVELVRDAFGDLFELDSRLWRTIIPLALRPGRLTEDYLRGRRTRYMPPFRMYLVLSLSFFLIAFFDPYDELGILFAPVETSSSGDPPVGAGGAADGAGASEDSPGGTGGTAAGAAGTGENTEARTDDESGDGSNPAADGADLDRCNFEDYAQDEMPAWFARRFTRERLEAACRNVVAEGRQSVADRMVENVPAGLFLLLPVMALVLMALYPLSRRYYVEHLLFVVHYHSFVFLALSVEILFGRLVGATGVTDALSDLAGIATAIYIPVYLYKAMRRVYRQGHFATLPKFLLLTVAYGIGLLLIVAVAGFFAAFSA